MHDMVGIEEIVGDDILGDGFVGEDDAAGIRGIDALVGAYKALKAQGTSKAARQADSVKALISKRVEAGSIVRDVNPSKSREYVVGFDVTPVAGLGTQTIPKQPQVLFRPERIIVPSNVAFDFMISDVKIGKNSQFTASGEVSAVTFIESAFGVRLKMDTCQISMQIILSVRNLSANDRNFMASIIGPAVE